MTEIEELEDEYVYLTQQGRNDDALIISDMIDELVDKGMPNAGDPIGDYKPDSQNIMTPFLKGAAFNLSDEAIGGVSATYQKIHGMLTGSDESSMFGKDKATFKENYEEARDQERADQEAFAEANPGTNFAMQLAGGLTTGGYGATKAMGSNIIANAPKLTKLGALSGIAGAEGMAYGFGEGEGTEESLDKAATQGMFSAVAAPVMKLALDKVLSRVMKGQAGRVQDKLQKTHTAETIKVEADKFYKLADESGVHVKAEAFTKFKTDLIDELGRKGVNVGATPRQSSERAVFNSIKRMLNTEEPTYQDLAAMRELLDTAKASSQGDVKYAAFKVSNAIDDFIDRLSAKDLLSGNAAGLSANLTKAKDFWHKTAQSKTLSDLHSNALISEAKSVEGDLDKAMRQEIRSLLKSSGKKRGIEKETLTSLRAMITGTPEKRIYRAGAQMAPGSSTRRGGIPTASAGLAALTGYGITGGNPLGILAGVLPAGVGSIMKSIANKMTQSEYSAIQNAILNKNQPLLEDVITSLISKYTSGAAANLSAQSASSLSDMVQD